MESQPTHLPPPPSSPSDFYTDDQPGSSPATGAPERVTPERQMVDEAMRPPEERPAGATSGTGAIELTRSAGNAATAGTPGATLPSQQSHADLAADLANARSPEAKKGMMNWLKSQNWKKIIGWSLVALGAVITIACIVPGPHSAGIMIGLALLGGGVALLAWDHVSNRKPPQQQAQPNTSQFTNPEGTQTAQQTPTHRPAAFPAGGPQFSGNLGAALGLQPDPARQAASDGGQSSSSSTNPATSTPSPLPRTRQQINRKPIPKPPPKQGSQTQPPVPLPRNTNPQAQRFEQQPFYDEYGRPNTPSVSLSSTTTTPSPATDRLTTPAGPPPPSLPTHDREWEGLRDLSFSQASFAQNNASSVRTNQTAQEAAAATADLQADLATTLGMMNSQ